MPIKPPFTDLLIGTSGSGFYRGFGQAVTISSKLMDSGLVARTCNAVAGLALGFFNCRRCSARADRYCRHGHPGTG